MSPWDAMTWASVVVLGPGAVVVFVAVLWDVRRLLARSRATHDESGGT